MAALLTIGGAPYTLIEDSLDIVKALDERQRMQVDVIDYAGTAHFQKGEQVILSDPVLGTVFRGIMNSDKEVLQYPSGAILHSLDCVGPNHWADKRTYTRTYRSPTYAGKIFIDHLTDVLAQEGVTKNYAQKSDSTVENFGQGIIDGVVALPDVDDGDLELTRAGTDLTVTEGTTAQFASGTLTNMQAISNTLVPLTVNAIKLQTTLSFSYGTEFAQEQQKATGTASGTASGSFSTGVNSSGSFSTTVSSSGSFNTSVSSSGSYTPAGSVFISGGNPGESASFSGFGGSIFVSGNASGTVNSSGTASAMVNSSGTAAATVNAPFSAPLTASVSKVYKPRTRSKVKVDKTHYAVVTVDRAVSDNRVDAIIWTGSMTVGVNDTLCYDIWIASTSPSQEAGVDLAFSDGTVMTQYLGTKASNHDTGLWDQNLVSISPIQDLSEYAKDTWYTRQISLSALSGKVITKVSIFTASNLAGVYDVYIKNCYLDSHSGTPFFGITQTTPSLNPPVLSSIGAYIRGATLLTVVPVYVPATSTRISPAYSIDSVQLVRGSFITWNAYNPIIGPSVVPNSPGAAETGSTTRIFVSYDGTTWMPCVKNQPIPGLPPGANVSGLSLYLMEQFTGGQDPSAIPSLSQVTLTIQSAAAAVSSDITSFYGTTIAWNSGTKQGLAPNAAGDLILGKTTYTWSSLVDTAFVSGYLVDSDVVTPVASVAGGALQIFSIGDSDGDTWSESRFNFISAAQDFTIEGDFTLNASSPLQNEIGFLYRQTYWGSPNNSFAYYVRIMQNPGGSAGGTSITLGYGLNNPPTQPDATTSGLYTTLVQVGKTISNNTTYHVKVVVSGERHQVYWNNESSPSIDVLDDTYTQPGNIGIRTYVFMGNTNNSTNKIANFSITNTFAGIWTSPAISLSSLGTCGNTQIAWSEVNVTGAVQSTAIVSASLDGGVTWQQCTNGSGNPNTFIPGLAPGTSVTGKSLIIQIVMSATGFLESPIMMGLYWRVCGAYPGSSGSRSTVPMGLDTMQRGNLIGSWGPTTDSQNYTKVGTGTVNLNSNEGQISATTGDVHMVYGLRVWDDEEGTVRFSLSDGATAGGMELRYVDANNYYRLSVMTTSLIIAQRNAGVSTILATTSVSLSTNTFYYLRFRVVSNGPVLLYGKVWPDGTLEPDDWDITAQV